ncbi:MAG: hypothetical protein KJZ65_06550 [Phycisphaerales bacterium]|nr:hypothetical protein [Phycisphaerales bacterium]
MIDLLEQNRILRAALVGLVGSEDPSVWDQMEIILRSTNVPNSDRVSGINAIDALRRTMPASPPRRQDGDAQEAKP